MRYQSTPSPRANPRRRLLLTLIATASFAVPAAVLPQAAPAYNVCHDEGEPCIHETMVGHAMNVLKRRPGGPTESDNHIADLKGGAGDEDVRDHVYGHEDAGLLKDAFITITHFWDADRGPDDRVEIAGGLLDYPNAWQKAKSLWAMALGHYAEGNKQRAYEYVGHVAHLIGDMTVPTHAHDDTHVDLHDDDPYEEWMSGSARPLPLPEELYALEDAGPLKIPAGLDGLEYLMYSTNQIADFFPSMDEEGDTDDPRGWVRAELDALDRTVTSPRTIDDLEDNDDGNHNDDGDLGVIRKHSYLRGISAIAALIEHFERTVARQPTLRVVFDRLEEDEDHDDVGDKPDYWTEVQIAGRQAQNRGDRVRDNNDLVNPGFAFAHPVGTSGSAHVQLAVWDFDGWTGNPFVRIPNKDDLSDIDPDREDEDSTLQLDVDLAKCMRREAGAISGDVSGRCGEQLITGGDDGSEATKVYFRVVMSKSAPTADAGDPVSTDEGAPVKLDGSRSSDPDNDIETYAWDLDGDGACDDVADDPTPDFGAVGQDGVTNVKLCVTDATGLTAEDTTTVTVRNVAPSVAVAAPAPVDENRPVAVTGSVTDPGWHDHLTATIAWGDGAPAQSLAGTLENDRPDATLRFAASHTYGDNGTYTGRICAADDDTQPCETFTVTVGNTPPAVAIDLSGAVSVGGVPTVIAHAGAAVDFRARTTDPGSDDLALTWSWGDGTADETTQSLVNPPDADPALSPSVQPRDVPSALSHPFGGACAYEARFAADDDDGGRAQESVNVIIVGNGTVNHPHGWWKQQLRHHVVGKGPSEFDAAKLGCYLKIAGYMSRVFDERTAAATLAQAYDVLDVSGTSVMTELFDLQLLAAWLNFANGAIEHDRMVDTDQDGVADTRFLAAMADAEALRLDPSSTQAQLDRAKRIVERWTSLP